MAVSGGLLVIFVNLIGQLMSNIIRFPSPHPVPLSSAVGTGGFLFLSGQLAIDANGQIIDGGIREQTQLVMTRIADTLKACGSSMDQVVKVTVWLADLEDFQAFNQEYSKHFNQGFPARSTVRADLYKGARVEIEVQALSS